MSAAGKTAQTPEGQRAAHCEWAKELLGKRAAELREEAAQLEEIAKFLTPETPVAVSSFIGFAVRDQR